MPTAVEIARGLLTNAAKRGIDLTERDLHRLAVHAQAWFMAGHQQPLFTDPIIAGNEGAVVPAIAEALVNGGIARFAHDDEAYDQIGRGAYWQTSAAVLDHIEMEPRLSGPKVIAEIDAVVAGTKCDAEVDREALRLRTRAEIDKHRGPPLDPDAAIRRLDEDPEFLQQLLDRAARPLPRRLRP